MAAKTGTYTLIASTTGSNSSPEITFASIPSNYTDLVLVANITPSDANTVIGIYFNNTLSPTCSSTWMVGNGTGAFSSRSSGADTIRPYGLNASFSTSQPSTFILNVMDYSNTNTYKTTLHRFNNASSVVVAGTGLWQSTAAISQITLSTLNGGYYWNTASTFKLYGIEAGNL